jgi:hypothetical protein
MLWGLLRFARNDNRRLDAELSNDDAAFLIFHSPRGKIGAL